MRYLLLIFVVCVLAVVGIAWQARQPYLRASRRFTFSRTCGNQLKLESGIAGATSWRMGPPQQSSRRRRAPWRATNRVVGEWPDGLFRT